MNPSTTCYCMHGPPWSVFYSQYHSNQSIQDLTAVKEDTSHTIKSIVADVTAKLDCALQHPGRATSTGPARPGPQRYLYATGPYALELTYPGDDVHLVCLTDNSAKTFWSYVSEKLGIEDLPPYDCPIADLTHGGKIWLHYCPLPRNFDPVAPRGLGLAKIPHGIQHAPSSTQNLRGLYDTWHLLEFVGVSAPVFKRAYKTIRTFAIQAGICSASFGTLDADSLLWMLFRAVPSSLPEAHDDAHTLIKAFFIMYSAAYSADMSALRLVHTPSGRRVFDPPPHIADDASLRVARVLLETNSFALHNQKPAEHWRSFINTHGLRLITEPATHLRGFVNDHWILAVVTAECWVPKHRLELQDKLVAKIARIPAEIHRGGLTSSAVSIWPYAFRPSDDEWIYLIGIEQRPDSPYSHIAKYLNREGHFPGSASTNPDPEQTKREDAEPKAALSSLLEPYDFELDPTVGQASARLCKPQEALDLLAKHGAPDPFYTPQPALEPSSPTNNPVPAQPAKLPTAAQALSRLRWDPVHAARSYEVGYEDRFEGLMWLPLEQWGKATEDEEFIPEHRIRVLRRLGDGKVVWDREARFCDF